MRLRRTPSSRAVRVSALLFCLAGPADITSVARSDAPAATRSRGMDAGPLDSWEQSTVRFEETGTTGGVSDGDDWLG
jgi:hypothetical protein